jgi:hypothetical protein
MRYQWEPAARGDGTALAGPRLRDAVCRPSRDWDRNARSGRARGPQRGALSQFLSHSSPSGTVHRCSPGSCLRSSRTAADAGERRPTLLESVLGQPLRSSNLLSSATPDQPIHPAGHGHVRLCSLICSLIHSTHIGIKCPKRAGARCWMLSWLWPPTRATGPVGPGAVTGHRVKVHQSPPAHSDRSVPASAHDHHGFPGGRRIARQPPQERSRI